MELRQIRYFVAVAEELHFGRAARRLNIEQPPLSRQIQNLERELGVRLFDRNRRRVQLSLAGAVFRDRIQQVLRDVEKAAEAALRAERGEIGNLEIGYSPGADLAILPVLVPAIRKQLPDIALALHNISGPPLLQALRDGRVHVVISRLPTAENDFDALILSHERLVAVLPEDHELVAAARLSICDLAKEKIILFPRRFAPIYYDSIAAFCAEKGQFTFVLAQESETIQTTLGLVAVGMGVSLQPESIRCLTRAGVVFRTIEDCPPFVQTGIIYRKGDQSQLLRNFVKIAQSKNYPNLKA